jgi:peroxiredoxin
MHDPMSLPSIPAVPEDDGAAAHLPGLELPDLTFASTEGRPLNLRVLAARRLVLYVYPRTGVPGVEPPRGWDAIPGARGCTPQSCAFRDDYAEFASRDYRVAGLSAQTPEEQSEASARLRLPFPLLSDPERELAAALMLPTFEIASMTLYKRLTLVAHDAKVIAVFYPVFPPEENATEVLAWIGGQELEA